MTALAGAIPFKIGGLASNIEVVRTVPGVTAREVDALAVGAEFGDRKIRVLDPISLLLCKVDLALTVRQKDRQDVAHLKILFYCVRGFLRNVLRAVESGDAPAKGWLGAVNRVIRLIRSSTLDVRPPKNLRFTGRTFCRWMKSNGAKTRELRLSGRKTIAPRNGLESANKTSH